MPDETMPAPPTVVPDAEEPADLAAVHRQVADLYQFVAQGMTAREQQVREAVHEELSRLLEARTPEIIEAVRAAIQPPGALQALTSVLRPLLGLIYGRLFAVAATVLVVLVQGAILSVMLWLATMRATFQVPVTTYAVLASIYMVVNVLGIPVAIWLLLRAERTPVGG